MSLELRTHNDSEPRTADDLFGEHFGGDRLRGSLVCTDMDFSMFNRDLGVLVFLEKLSDPTFWKFSIDKFAGLLLPQRYINIIARGARGMETGLNPSDCKIIVALYRDICNLYKKMKERVDGKEPLNINTPLVNEFALKMIAIDALIKKIDVYLKEVFGGQLLIRTRWFAGKNQRVVYEMAARVMDREEDAEDRTISLQVHEENRLDAHQVITSDDLGEHVSYPFEQDRLVQVYTGVRDLISRLFVEHSAKVKIVTTNLRQIAETAIQHSSYDFLTDPDTVVASVLDEKAKTRRRGKRSIQRISRMCPRFQTMPVHGTAKDEIACRIAAARERAFLVAIGDSKSNDRYMGARAVRNGGAFVIVGPYEDQRAEFDEVHEELVDEGISDAGDRMWYVEPATKAA